MKFYEKAGFRKLKTGMVLYQSESLKMEYTEKHKYKNIPGMCYSSLKWVIMNYVNNLGGIQ